MQVYQVNGKWYVEVDGGRINMDIIPSDVKGPFSEKPIPVAKWQEKKERKEGRAEKIFTQFIADNIKFTVLRYTWIPAPGYSWSEWWEDFVDAEPPTLGEAYYWTGEGWEPIPHPMEVEA